MTIEEIKKSRYLFVKNINSAFGRKIMLIDSITRLSSSEYRDEYSVKVILGARSTEYKLVYQKQSKRWSIGSDVMYYTVIDCTNNIAELLQLEDVLVFDLGPSQDYVKARVVKLQPKFNRIIVEVLGERHNLSTMYKRYGSNRIVGVITYDDILNSKKKKTG